MSRWTGRLRYFLTDAADEWLHSPGVNLLAAATLAFALFVAGLFLLLLSNVEGMIGRMKEEAPVQVYLREGATEDERAEVEKVLASTPGVTGVRFVEKEEAMRRFRDSFGRAADLADELDSNPLPDSFEASLEEGPAGNRAADSLPGILAGHAGVEEVRFDRAWRERIDGLLRVARTGGLGGALVVFAAVSFIMASVLRLAVYSRRDEIQIMLLVGASPSFVRGPFLMAGLFQGLTASLLALGLVEGIRRAAVAWTGSRPGTLVDLAAGRGLGLGASAALVAVGLAVALAGSFLAVRRFE